MPDRYNGSAVTSAGPYVSGFVITPADGADLPETTSAIAVGVAGNIRVLMADGTDLIIPVTAGLHRLRVRRVFSTSTTATGLVGLL